MVCAKRVRCARRVSVLSVVFPDIPASHFPVLKRPISWWITFPRSTAGLRDSAGGGRLSIPPSVRPSCARLGGRRASALAKPLWMRTPPAGTSPMRFRLSPQGLTRSHIEDFRSRCETKLREGCVNSIRQTLRMPTPDPPSKPTPLTSCGDCKTERVRSCASLGTRGFPSQITKSSTRCGCQRSNSRSREGSGL